MAKDIMSEVKRVIQEQLDVDPAKITTESRFIDDLGADSLAIVELVLKLEETFQITIPDSESEKIRTVRDAISYIEQHAVAA
jgi:acyl carrier protein